MPTLFKGTRLITFETFLIPYGSVSSSKTLGLKAIEGEREKKKQRETEKNREKQRERKRGRERERDGESKTSIKWNPGSSFHIQIYKCKVCHFDIIPMVDHCFPDEEMGKVTATSLTHCPASTPGVGFLHAKGAQLVPMIQNGDLDSLIFSAIQAGSEKMFSFIADFTMVYNRNYGFSHCHLA